MKPVSQTLWTWEEAARATGARSDGIWQANGVSIDSRTINRGDLFVALEGPTFDGHDFVAEAMDKGAVAAMVTRRPGDVAGDANLLVVEDTLAGLQSLGRAARARSRARVMAVTGSVGKTSVKEAMRLALSAQAKTAANEGSLNNHWGLPLSLARLPRDAQYAVFEIGMNHAGEITPLSRLARPHIAVITSVEAVHKAHFTSIEEIADAKAEIFAGVEPGGVAILNRDNDQFSRLSSAAGAAGINTVIPFGRHPDAGVRVLEEVIGSSGSTVVAQVAGETIECQLSVPGKHWVLNTLCILATVAAAGADVRAAARTLSRFEPPKRRGQRFIIGVGTGAFTLIDDSYNASPSSMLAAFDVLGRTKPGSTGRRIAVLGDMLELDDPEERHRGLSEPLQQNGIDLVFTAGASMIHLFDALPSDMRGGHAPDAATLATLVVACAHSGDVIAVKGSAGSRMSVVVDALKALDRGLSAGSIDTRTAS
ncbi:MAG: UDP-N-acetylmuramoylalanyl-D-glutamyl-2,6-diaminopimelate--D-alanyl-D-alanine ligase [Rhodospirillales bacterium]|nr:UDP-N-acetylmuramoylalanyl-D-glutamyl-2,6-diaminopimelate--D-alanyl-D-alanine ligase [Rhodospirillales bacterium]